MQSQRKKMPRTGEGRITLPILVMIGGALMVLAVAAMYGWNWYSDRGGTDAVAATSGPSAAETSFPVGPIQVAGVEVLQPVADAGQIPLNTPVQRLWRLRNTGTTRVTIGLPSIEVLEGC
jgi:hypothetical protein